MEATYVKQTVGPVLTEALASLLMHVPYPGQNPSSYDTTLDPISYIGQYLVDYAASEERQKEIDSKITAMETVERAWKEALNRQKVAREMLGESLTTRLSIRRSQIEAMDPKPIRLPAVAKIPEVASAPETDATPEAVPAAEE